MIDREQFDDLLSARMARYDEALAGDTAPPDWDEPVTQLDPHLATEWEQAKSCLELLDRARRGGLSIAGDLSAAAAFPGRDAAVMPRQLGRFRIERELGRGGLGIVYLAHDPQLSRKVALKIPRVDVVVHGDSQRRFLREAEAASRLSHPNIVSLYEVGEDGTTCYLACEYCTGPTLSQWLRRRSEPVDARQAATIVLRLAEAVEHAHSRGVLHRDIKPGNVMLAGAGDAPPDRNSTDDEELVPKLTDFGLAKLTEQAGGETRTGAVLGTLAYMSPEQAEGRLAELDSRTDVYALGAILYELLTGAAPYLGNGDADTLRQLLLGELTAPRRARPDLSRDLEAITMKCLAGRPADRYATAHEVALDLNRFLAGEPTVARPIAAWERVLKWTRRRPAAAALVAVSTLAAISLLGVGAIYSARLEVAHVRSRQLLYAADMKTGFEGYRAGHLPTVEQRLDMYRPAAGGDDLQTFAWRLLDALSRPPQRTLYEHPAPALSLAWSPDGRLVASGGRDYVIRLMDLERSRMLPPLEGHAEDINSLAFSPDGRLLASASDDRTVRVWTVDGSAPVRVISDFSDLSAYGVAFSPDGAHLIVGSEDALVRVWRTNDWKLTKTWSHHKARVNRVAISADGRRLVTCSHDGTAQVLNFPSGTVLSVCKVAKEANRPVDCVAISPDGSMVATCCIFEHSFAIWSADTGKRSTSNTGYDNTIYNLAFSADGRLVAGALRSGAIRIWDAVNRETRHTLLAHEAAARDVRFSKSGDMLLSCGIDGQVKLLEVESSDRRESQRSTIRPVKSVAFQTGGHHFAYLEANGETVLLDANSGSPTLRIQTGEVGPRALTVFSGSGGRFAYAIDGGRELRLLDVATREVRSRLPFAEAPILAATFVDNDRRLICSDTSGTLSVWDVASGRRLRQTSTDQREIYAILPLVSRGLVATIDPSGARLHDAQTLQLRRELPRFLDRLHAAAASAPDDSAILAGTTTGKVVVWDLAAGGTRTDLVGHDGYVNALAYCPTGDTFASCGSDGKVYLWDHRTLQQVGELNLHSGVAEAIAFSPDGTTAALGGSRSDRGMLRFWSADSYGDWTCDDHLAKPITYDLLTDESHSQCIEAVGHFLLDSPDVSAATLDVPVGSLVKFNQTSIIGAQGQARFELGRGARVDANEELIVGRFSGSHGQLTLHEDSQWHSNHYVTVGDTGWGELKALAGASIQSARIHVGAEVSSQGLVDLKGPGTVWTSNAICVVGEFGHGRIRLSDGARFLVERDITIGHRGPSDGELTVTDAGSEVRTPELYIGDRGRAALHVARGALVDCQKVVMAQSDGRADLSVTDDGSRFTCHGTMFVAGNSYRAGGQDANVMIGRGATLAVGDFLRIWKQGVVSVDGGTLDVQTLDVAAGGAIDWRGGVMVCRGTAHLKGQLDLSNNADIAGAIGQRMTVLTYDKRVGELQIVGAPPKVVVEAEYGEKELSLKVSAKPGP